MEEILEQLAIYNRLYYKKRREDEAYMQKKRDATQRYLQKKKIREYEEKHNIKLNQEEISDELLTEIMTTRKAMKPKRATQQYDMSNFKIITPKSE